MSDLIAAIVFGSIILYGLWITVSIDKAMEESRKNPRSMSERWKFEENYEREERR